MAIITLTTDFGYQDHYVAAIKAKFITPGQHHDIIDISHNITPFNLIHASYVLKSVFRDFPEGTIHMVSVNEPSNQVDKCVVIKLEGHYFFCLDNGFYSLISEQEPEWMYELSGSETAENHVFYARNILTPAIKAFVNGAKPEELGKPLPQLRRMLNKQLKLTRNMIVGSVQHVDRYGNLITDIEKIHFDNICKDRNYRIKLGRENTEFISANYTAKENGDIMAVFNSNGLMEIALSRGNAASLLGLKKEYPIIIQFTPEI